jgi:hypothetical protein
MIEGFDLDRHALSFRRDAPGALSACGKLCYNRVDFEAIWLSRTTRWENP